MVGGHLTTQGGLWSALVRPAWYRGQQRELMEAAEGNLAAVGLGALADAKAGILTYGQQRRLEIARALAARPRLLLLDEPAAGLSVTESRELLEIIRSVTRSGITVMLIDHDMSLVMDIADKVIVLDFGRKICEGVPSHVRQDEKVLKAYLSTSDKQIRVRAPKLAVS
jgi:branched-chain amino acid transport system ATP-binding protein